MPRMGLWVQLAAPEGCPLLPLPSQAQKPQHSTRGTGRHPHTPGGCRCPEQRASPSSSRVEHPRGAWGLSAPRGPGWPCPLPIHAKRHQQPAMPPPRGPLEAGPSHSCVYLVHRLAARALPRAGRLEARRQVEGLRERGEREGEKQETVREAPVSRCSLAAAPGCAIHGAPTAPGSPRCPRPGRKGTEPGSFLCQAPATMRQEAGAQPEPGPGCLGREAQP